MFTQDGLKAYYHDNSELIAMRPVVRYRDKAWYVLKYKNKVFYRGLWTPEMCEFRGTVVDASFNVIMRPPTKIFNLGERNTYIAPSKIVTAVSKVNGFMGHCTIRDGEFLVGTTGSMDSDFADCARRWLEPLYVGLSAYGEGITWTFEIVDPDDPHIVPEKPGAYLLACRANTWNTPDSIYNQGTLDAIADRIGCFRPAWYDNIPFSDVMCANRATKTEGFVAYSPETTLKLKSPHYLVTKFLGRMKISKLENALEDVDQFKKTIDEEFYGLIDYLATIKNDKLAEMDTQERIAAIRSFLKGDVLC